MNIQCTEKTADNQGEWHNTLTCGNSFPRQFLLDKLNMPSYIAPAYGKT